MESLHKKTWTDSVPASKKFLSRLLSYNLSSRIDQNEYEVVFEIPLIKGDEAEPDVVVFDKRKGWTSIMALEICGKDEINDLMIIARSLMEKYSLLDFFIFEQDSKTWYNIKKGPLGYYISSNTVFLGVDLDELGVK